MDRPIPKDGIRVVLADDHPRTRYQLRHILEGFADVVVVGEAPDGIGAVRLARELNPDLVLIDLHMPGMGGTEATAEIVKLEKPPRVVVLTASGAPKDLLDAIDAGAVGYLLKGSSPAEIGAAVRAALNGGVPLACEVAGALLEHVRDRIAEAAEPQPLPPLTDRESMILELLASGRGNNEIAEELFVSVATVKICMAEMFKKLGVDSRAQAAVLAVHAGIV